MNALTKQICLSSLDPFSLHLTYLSLHNDSTQKKKINVLTAPPIQSAIRSKPDMPYITATLVNNPRLADKSSACKCHPWVIWTSNNRAKKNHLISIAIEKIVNTPLLHLTLIYRSPDFTSYSGYHARMFVFPSERRNNRLHNRCYPACLETLASIVGLHCCFGGQVQVNTMQALFFLTITTGNWIKL